MSKKGFIQQTITCALLSLLVIIFTLPSSAEIARDWYDDGVYVFGSIFTEEYSYSHIPKDLTGRSEYIYESEEMYTITGIFELTKRVELEVKTGSGHEYDNILDYDAYDISTFIADNFYYHNYVWDEPNNRIVLTRFDVAFFDVALSSINYFIEPDWEVFNTNMEYVADRTQIVDTVSDGVTTHQITLGDFLDSIPSYKIMGISNILETPLSFSNSSTKWTLTFDLSNYIYDYEWDSSEDEYIFFPFSKYIVSTTLDYSDGGTLNSYDYTLSYEVTVDEYIYKGVEEYRIKIVSASTFETPYNFSYVLLSFLIVPVVVYIFKRKKR